MKHPITQTRNGITVYVDLVQSPSAAHIAAQPSLLGLVKETLERTKLDALQVRMEKDMGRSIGYDSVIETTNNDTVFYAQLIRGDKHIPFVKKGEPLATPYLTIILKRIHKGEYELHDTWIGRLRPPLPGGSDETLESKAYWSNHAHIFDRQPLQLRTITKVCPY